MKSVSELLAADGSHENWIPLLDTAAKEVFELMLGCQLTASKTTEETNMDVTAMVGLAGQLCGVLSVRCDRKAATLMTSKMLGVAPDKVGPEVADALGEVCNMVAGNFKNKIAGLAEGCMLSPPTVITGSDYNLHSMADSPAIEIRMLFESMPIAISLQIHS
ncbi:MAG: chemotaxis protein CheX [Candidatus Sulfotelmatobacter sp.]